MTNREFMTAIANNTTLPADVVEYAKVALSNIKPKKTHDVERKALMDVLADHTPRTARDIVNLNIGIGSTSLATVVAKEIPNLIIGSTPTPDGTRIVKTYAL